MGMVQRGQVHAAGLVQALELPGLVGMEGALGEGRAGGEAEPGGQQGATSDGHAGIRLRGARRAAAGSIGTGPARDKRGRRLPPPC